MNSPRQRCLRQLASILLTITLLCGVAGTGMAQETPGSGASGRETAGRTLQKCQENPYECSYGVLGDDQADEYADIGIAGYNWVEQLVALRHLNFGYYRFDQIPHAPDETVHEYFGVDERVDTPRKGGYSQNWSQAWATVTTPTALDVGSGRIAALCRSLFGGECMGYWKEVQGLENDPKWQVNSFQIQVNGIVDQVKKGEIQVVFLVAGVSDVWVHYDRNSKLSPTTTFEDKLSLALADVVVQLVEAFYTADNDPIIVVAKVQDIDRQDYGLAGTKVKEMLERLNTALEIEIEKAVMQWCATGRTAWCTEHDVIDEDGALEINIPLVDSWGFLKDPDRHSDGSIHLGRYSIETKCDKDLTGCSFPAAEFGQLVRPDDPRRLDPCRWAGPEWADPGTSLQEPEKRCPTLEYNLHFWTNDKEYQHETTPIHSLIANEFLRALNDSYGIYIRPLNDIEILKQAGVDYGNRRPPTDNPVPS